MTKNTPYFIHALSPLHPGVGQGVGGVDLPVAREKATGIPSFQAARSRAYSVTWLGANGTLPK